MAKKPDEEEFSPPPDKGGYAPLHQAYGMGDAPIPGRGKDSEKKRGDIDPGSINVVPGALSEPTDPVDILTGKAKLPPAPEIPEAVKQVAGKAALGLASGLVGPLAVYGSMQEGADKEDPQKVKDKLKLAGAKDADLAHLAEVKAFSEQLAAAPTQAERNSLIESARRSGKADLVRAWMRYNPEAAAQVGPVAGQGGGGGGGAPRGAPMQMDAQGNLLPRLVRTSMSQTVQGQVPIPQEVTDLYGNAAQHGLAGIAANAEADAQKAQAEHEGASAVQVVSSRMQQARMKNERSRREEVEMAMGDMEDRLARMESMQIDPEAFTNSKTGLQKFQMGLALALSTLGSSLTHTGNVVQSMIQQGIQQSLEAQKMTLQKMGMEMGAQKTLYGQMLALHGDERAAEAATEAQLMKFAEMEFRKKLALAQDPRIQAQLETNIAGLQSGLADKMLELAKLRHGVRSTQQGFALPRPTGGGGAPKKPDPERAHWLAMQLGKVQPAKQAFDAARAKLGLFLKENPDGKVNGMDPFGTMAMLTYKSSPQGRWLYKQAFGDQAESVLRATMGAESAQRQAETGAAFNDKEALDHMTRIYGSGGVKALGEGLGSKGAMFDDQYNGYIAADPEAFDMIKQGHAAHGTKGYTPQYTPPSLPAKEE